MNIRIIIFVTWILCYTKRSEATSYEVTIMMSVYLPNTPYHHNYADPSSYTYMELIKSQTQLFQSFILEPMKKKLISFDKIKENRTNYKVSLSVTILASMDKYLTKEEIKTRFEYLIKSDENVGLNSIIVEILEIGVDACVVATSVIIPILVLIIIGLVILYIYKIKKSNCLQTQVTYRNNSVENRDNMFSKSPENAYSLQHDNIRKNQMSANRDKIVTVMEYDETCGAGIPNTGFENTEAYDNIANAGADEGEYDNTNDIKKPQKNNVTPIIPTIPAREKKISAPKLPSREDKKNILKKLEAKNPKPNRKLSDQEDDLYSTMAEKGGVKPHKNNKKDGTETTFS